MRKLKLHYFDADGGRGEPTRLALFHAGIPFEDHRISRADWPQYKAQMPFGAIPVLEVDDRPLSQSNAINRFVGRLTGLYPEDVWQAALCDEVMDALEDITQKLVATFPMADEPKRAARAALAEGALPLYLRRFETMLQERGDYLADNRLTMADLQAFVWVRQLCSGVLSYLPTDLVERHAPLLLAHAGRVGSEPRISEYYARRQEATAG